MAEVYKPWPLPLVQHLTADGLHNGSKDMTVDGSSTPVQFWIQPPKGWVFFLHRMLFHIQDTRSGFTPDVYAAEASALTTGLQIQYKDANQVWCHFHTDNDPIKQNSHWSKIMFDTRLDSISAGAPTNAVFIGQLVFTAFGKPLILDGDGNGQRLSVFVRDDLTGIVSHEIVVQGQAFQHSRELYGSNRRLDSAKGLPIWY